MAFVAGTVQFNLVANTAGLRRAQADLNKFNSNIGRTARGLGRDLTPRFKSVDKGATIAGKRVGRFNERMTELSKVTQIAAGPLSGIAARITALSSLAKGSSVALAGLAGAIIGVGAAAGALLISAGRVAFQIDKMQAGFLAASGSMAEANRQMEFAIRSAKELGVDIQAVSQGFATFSAAAAGTALEGREAREVFEGIATAAAAMKLNASQTQGVMRAVTQIMSKGTVQAEELRGQLGERLPGAFNIMSRALGVTTTELNKMLEQGEVLAASALPAFAKQLQKEFSDLADKNVKTLQGRLNNLKNEFFLLSEQINETAKVGETLGSVFDIVANEIGIVRQAIESQAIPSFEDLREQVKELNKEVRDSDTFLDRVFQGFSTLSGLGTAGVSNIALNLIKDFLDGAEDLQEIPDDLIANKIDIPADVAKRINTVLTDLELIVQIPEKRGKKAIEFAGDLRTRMSDLQSILSADNPEKQKRFVKSLEEARKAVKDFGEDDIANIRNLAKAFGVVVKEGDSAVDIMAKLIVKEKQLEKQVKNLDKELKPISLKFSGSSDSLKDLNNEIEILTAKVNGVNPSLIEARQLFDSLSLSERAALVRELGVAYSEIPKELAKYIDKQKELTKELDRQEEAAKKAKKAAEEQTRELVQIFDRGFDRIGDAITEAFVRGEEAAIDFGNIAKAVLSEVIQGFLQLAAINPLKNAVFSGQPGFNVLPTFTSVLSGGGQGSGLFGNIISRGNSLLGLGGGAAATAGTLTQVGAQTGGATQFFATAAGGNTAAGGATNFLGGTGGLGTALGAAGLGALGGGIFSDLLGGSKIGGSIGGGIGAAIGSLTPLGPVGGLIGGAFGSAIGGLFGGDKDFPFAQAQIAVRGGRAQVGRTQELDKGDIEAITKLANAASEQINTLFGALGIAGANINLSRTIGTASGRSRALGTGFFAGTGGSFARGAEFTNIQSPEQAVNAAVLSALQAPQVLRKVDDRLADVIKSAKNVDELKETISRFQQVKAVIESFNEEHGDFLTRLDQLKLKFQEVIKAAQEFGFSTDMVTKAYIKALRSLENTIIGEIRNIVGRADQILGIGQLRQFQQSLTLGNLNPASPTTQFQQAQGLLQETTQSALGGNVQAIQQFPQLAERVLNIGRDVFASGPQFQQLFSDVTQSLNTILQQQVESQESLLAGIDITLQETSQEQIAELRDQTQVLVRELKAVKTEIQRRS